MYVVVSVVPGSAGGRRAGGARAARGSGTLAAAAAIPSPPANWSGLLQHAVEYIVLLNILPVTTALVHE